MCDLFHFCRWPPLQVKEKCKCRFCWDGPTPTRGARDRGKMWLGRLLKGKVEHLERIQSPVLRETQSLGRLAEVAVNILRRAVDRRS